MENRRKQSICILILVLAACTSAWAGMSGGVVFDDAVTVKGYRLSLRGTGVLHYMVLIKAYAAALYLPEEMAASAVLEPRPKRLEIEYFHAIEAKDFARATLESIRKNSPPSLFARLKPRIDAFNTLYRNVAPGDRYALNYAPGSGTTLLWNGQPLGTAHGEDIASALFGIWLGPSPLDRGLKQALLGRP